MWDGAKAIADGDTFHTKYQWSTEAKCMAGRLMLGIAAQGPPGSGHGGSIAAVLDDLIGVTGVMCALQLHLQGVFQSQEPFAGKVAPDAHKYISMALDVYYEKTAEEKAQFRLHPDLTFEQLERNRDKLLPYSAAEAAFIFAALAEGLRQMPDIPGSSFPPTGLVGEITCRLKKRVPLLTRLAVRARMTKLEGKRVHVIAEIYGKKTTRVTALDPDDSGGWEGDFDVLLAEGKGTLTVMYGTNLKGASQGAKI